MNDTTARRLAGALTAAALAGAAHAQDATRIVAATMYPDSASVERELKVPGGVRHVTIDCVPEGVDVSTLQVDGDPGLKLGEVRADELPAAIANRCAPDSAQARTTALDLKRADLESQLQADDVALAYLKQWGTHTAADAPAAPAPTPASAAGRRPGVAAEGGKPAAAADALRRAALDLFSEQARLRREMQDIAEQRNLVVAQRDRVTGKTGWSTLHFDVWTPAAAALRVRYLVADSHWSPSYRALVDVERQTMKLERQADIVQGSGEDWKDVRIRLSTARPRAAPQGPLPTPWYVDVLAPAPVISTYAAAPSIDRNSLQRVEITGSSIKPLPEPAWAAAVTQSGYATEFALAQPATLPSDGATHTFTIETTTLPVTLKLRTTPRAEPGAYLRAEAARPAGVWPMGPLQAYRDGTLVGRSAWAPATGDQLQVLLGRDDQIRVAVESPAGFTSAAGLLNTRTERASKAVYALSNDHSTPVTVEVLDATPVSRDEQVKIRSTFDPAPTATDWDKLPGVNLWTLAIEPHQTRRVSIDQVISYPKDANVTNLQR